MRSYDREVRSKAQVQLSYTEEATEKNGAQKGTGHCETGRTLGMGEGLEGVERKKMFLSLSLKKSHSLGLKGRPLVYMTFLCILYVISVVKVFLFS